MFADLDLLQPHAASGIPFHKSAGPTVCLGGERFASNPVQHVQLNQAGGPQLPPSRQVGIVGRYQQRVIEHLVQPGAQRLQSAKIDAPAPVVQSAAGKGEAECQRVAMQEPAVGLLGLPLAKGAGQPFLMPVGFYDAPLRS